MKPSQTVAEALKNTPAVRTAGDARAVLANVLLGLARKEISATDATAFVAVTDGMCNVLNTEIKAVRLNIEMQKAAGKSVRLTELGQTVIAGEPSKKDD